MNFQQSCSELILFLDYFLSCATPQLQQIQPKVAKLRVTFALKYGLHVNVSTISSPFAASVRSNSTKLTDLWKSQTDFFGSLIWFNGRGDEKDDEMSFGV
ncbi:hypothetical protein HAX54_028327 [Datura stramonium]|uniref:Uncharacterized protein n=1 Tax=Datura stramonium TaxID=4076 RepID=A0ABS8S9I9_DATST|nr:hypothetical protein [Datura stramonium]